MARFLAINWNSNVIRFVFGSAERDGVLRVLKAGERESESDETADDAQVSIVERVTSLVQELKATKATLLLCVNRSVVDSVTFSVPPASTAELPTIVRNMALRQLTGVSEDSVIDFVSYPSVESGGGTVSAMTLPVMEQQQIQDIIQSSGCSIVRAVVITQPLRIFATGKAEDDRTATLIVSQGAEATHVLIVQNGLPRLSRTIRLGPAMRGQEAAAYIASELQRTLISASSQIDEDIGISDVVVVGSEIEAAILVNTLGDLLSVDVRRVSSRSLLDGEAGDAAVGAYAPLIAALKEEALGQRPAVDFANPRRPPRSVNKRNRMLAIAAGLVVLLAGGWYFVHSQFSDITIENMRLRARVTELDALVTKTRSKRNLAKVLKVWEASRMSWLDELRDLTIRMPSSSELAVQQFSAGPSGSASVVSFRGTSGSPDAIRKMEDNLRDQYHQLRTPGIREVKDGKKSVWSFQTTIRVKSRQNTDYSSHLAENPESPVKQQSSVVDSNETSNDTANPGTRSSAPLPQADGGQP
ncbi:MAG: hypothetical protein P8K08_06425 [Fuerstiella sp.]|nr:hypothetical protein [Fuerstiella sp.]